MQRPAVKFKGGPISRSMTSRGGTKMRLFYGISSACFARSKLVLAILAIWGK